MVVDGAGLPTTDWEPAQGDAVAAALCDQLARAFSDIDLTLVVDDVHLFETECDAIDLLAGLVRHAPPTLHLVLASPRRPAVPHEPARHRRAGHRDRHDRPRVHHRGSSTPARRDLGRRLPGGRRARPPYGRMGHRDRVRDTNAEPAGAVRSQPADWCSTTNAGCSPTSPTRSWPAHRPTRSRPSWSPRRSRGSRPSSPPTSSSAKPASGWPTGTAPASRWFRSPTPRARCRLPRWYGSSSTASRRRRQRRPLDSTNGCSGRRRGTRRRGPRRPRCDAS